MPYCSFPSKLSRKGIEKWPNTPFPLFYLWKTHANLKESLYYQWGKHPWHTKQWKQEMPYLFKIFVLRIHYWKTKPTNIICTTMLSIKLIPFLHFACQFTNGWAQLLDIFISDFPTLRAYVGHWFLSSKSDVFNTYFWVAWKLLFVVPVFALPWRICPSFRNHLFLFIVQ